LVNWPVFANIESSLSEASAALFTCGFQKFIADVNVLTFERKI